MRGRLAAGLVLAAALLLLLRFMPAAKPPDFMAACATAAGGEVMSIVVEPEPTDHGHDLIFYCVVDGVRVLRAHLGKIEP